MIPHGLCEGISCVKNNPERVNLFTDEILEKRQDAICLTERDSVLMLRFRAADSVTGVPELRAERYFCVGRCLEVEVMADEWFT